MENVEEGVRFEHVAFGYGEENFIHDFNVDVKRGQMVAIVGPTGAGKTTIVNLISRFYDIEDGKILVDGYDLTKVSIESLRR